MSKKARREVQQAVNGGNDFHEQCRKAKQQIREVQQQPLSDEDTTPMWKQGWRPLRDGYGWYRQPCRDGEKSELIVYELKLPDDTLAEAMGRSMATKYHLPRSFAVEVAAQGGELFARLVLRGYDRATRAIQDKD